MMVITKNFHTGQVTTLDCDDRSVLGALKVMRHMRWAHVKRHGRKGARWYTVTMRNPDEWKRGYVQVDDDMVRVTLDK